MIGLIFLSPCYRYFFQGGSAYAFESYCPAAFVGRLMLSDAAHTLQLQKKESASVSQDPASVSAPVSDWGKFVNDYEKWADSYIELAEKVSKHPSDASLLSEYTDMAAKALDWAKEVASPEDTLSAQDAAAFAKEIARITAKLAKAGL